MIPVESQVEQPYAIFRYKATPNAWGAYIVKSNGDYSFSMVSGGNQFNVEFNARSQKHAQAKAIAVSSALKGYWYKDVTDFYKEPKNACGPCA